MFRSYYFELLKVKDLTVRDFSYASYGILEYYWSSSPCFLFGKILLSAALRTFCLPWRSIIAFLRVSAFSFFEWFFRCFFFFKYQYYLSILVANQMHDLMINHCYKFIFQKILFLKKNLENHTLYRFSYYLFYKLDNFYRVYFPLLHFCLFRM